MGQAPVQAKVYELQKLRCHLCGQVFTAEAPEGVGPEKYDASAAAMIALLKYGSGLPFNRLEGLQGNLAIPLPASTQWDIIDAAAQQVEPAYEELIRQAAQGEVLHNDDTTVKILEFMGERARQRALAENPPSDSSPPLTEPVVAPAIVEPEASPRRGLFTSGVVSTREGCRIALFFSGRRHAGENLAEMYRNDALAQKRKLSPKERLRFHQSESGPVMKRLQEWCIQQFTDRLVEPHSGLGEAIAYLLKHWMPLTLFLRRPGAPLDNPDVRRDERALKKAILHRKNALFYKTLNGAHVGDVFMSLIHTCELCGANPFDYLTELQRHAAELSLNPPQWLPWAYRATLQELVARSTPVA